MKRIFWLGLSILTTILQTNAQSENDYLIILDSLLEDYQESDGKEASINRIRSYGVRLKNQGRHTESIVVLNEALKLFGKHEIAQGYGRTLNNLGVSFSHAGARDSAYYYMFKSLAWNDSIGYEYGKLLNYQNLGNFAIYGDAHDFTSAEEYYQEALRIGERLGNDSKIADLNELIGSTYLLRDDGESREANLQTADRYYQLTENHYNTLKDSMSLLSLWWNKAMLLEGKGDYQNTAEAYLNALNLVPSSSPKLTRVGLYNNLGNAYMGSGNVRQSIESYRSGFAIALKAEAINQIQSLSENLSRGFERLSEFDSALYYRKLHEIYADSIYNETKARQIAELQTRYETEKKDKEIKLSQAKVELTTSQNEKLMLTLFTSIGFTLIIILIYSQRQKAVRKLQEREKELHEQEVDELIKEQELKSINSMLEGEEKERKRVAEDLHDRVGSMLSAVKLQADPTNTEMVKLLDETAEEVRRISHNLETKVLNRFGLVAALEDLAEKINGSESVHLEVHHLDLDERLDNSIEINVYRIVQELVGNALKHSRATEITAQINRIDPHLVISVEDNGVGFDSVKAKASEGMGLKNVTSRAEQLNGEINIDSGKGQGTVITIELPI